MFGVYASSLYHQLAATPIVYRCRHTSLLTYVASNPISSHAVSKSFDAIQRLAQARLLLRLATSHDLNFGGRAPARAAGQLHSSSWQSKQRWSAAVRERRRS